MFVHIRTHTRTHKRGTHIAISTHLLADSSTRQQIGVIYLCYIYICMFTYIYIYKYTYICTYVYICIYTHIHTHTRT